MTPQRIDPLSPGSRSSSRDVKLKVRLTQLQVEADERERRAERVPATDLQDGNRDRGQTETARCGGHET